MEHRLCLDHEGWRARVGWKPRTAEMRDWCRMHVKTLSHFLVGQCLLQLLTAAVGFLLVRWMSIEEYARYGLAAAFQGSMGMLAEVGITTAVVALVGTRALDRRVVGSFVKAATYIRLRLLLLVCLCGLGIFAFLAARQKWDGHGVALMYAVICAGVGAQLGSSIAALPLVLRGELGLYYRAQNLGALTRLGLVGIAAWCNAGSASIIMMINATGGLTGACLLRQWARSYCETPAEVDPAVRASVYQYIGPLIPSVLYMSVQGQLNLWIVSFFGAARPVAEVAALGRLGQVFTLLTVFNAVVVGPTAARSTKGRAFVRLYWRTVTGAAILTAGVGLVCCLWPRPLLWLLGEKYSLLGEPLRYVVATACLSYIASVLWALHSARSWVYWWGTWLFIGTLFSSQALGVWLLPVETTLGASQLGLVGAVATLLVSICTGFYGLLREARIGSMPSQEGPRAAGCSPAEEG